MLAISIVKITVVSIVLNVKLLARIDEGAAAYSLSVLLAEIRRPDGIPASKLMQSSVSISGPSWREQSSFFRYTTTLKEHYWQKIYYFIKQSEDLHDDAMIGFEPGHWEPVCQ